MWFIMAAAVLALWASNTHTHIELMCVAIIEANYCVTSWQSNLKIFKCL